MSQILPEFAVGATNVYRTKYFIVKQSVSVNCDEFEGNSVISHDTYYMRTRKRDAEYEQLFDARRHLNGKRLPTTMYTRRYVD